MLIISKYKDYYDYLQGIYGVDPKVVLDRRTNHLFSPYCGLFSEESAYSLHICDKKIDFVYTKDRGYFYLNELVKRYGKKGANNKVIKVDKWTKLSTEIITLDNPLTRKENCAILITNPGSNDIKAKYPILKDIHFNKIMSPQDVYLLLSDWLSPKDNIVSRMTDKEKILSQGFDLKTSFRNIK